MAQYGLSKQNGHSFPESFVPCSYAYYWNPNGNYSTGKLMSEAGVKYVNTLFDEISELNPPQGNNGGGFDNGVVVVNRITYGNEWFELSKVPTVDIESQESDMIESHWTNWLAQDDFMQPATNQQWINYYKMVQANPNRYVAKNTEQFHSQWLYNKYTTVTETTSGKVTIDNTNMPAEPYTYKLLGNMVLKIKLEPNQHISHALIDGKPVCSYFEDQGFGFIYLPMLTQKIYNLEYKIGDQNLTSFIFNKGTYNVYNFEPGKKQAQAEIRLYGTAEMDIYGVPNPKNIKLSNHQIMLVNSQYNESEKHLTLTIKAHNIQGETGIITFEY
jgi:hypothetical protein